MARKYEKPMDALFRAKQPKTEEHKKKISQSVNEFWAKAREQLAEAQQNELERG